MRGDILVYMEGTRHEKAALIIVAYVIGFTTAFIAFGLFKTSSETQTVFIPTHVTSADVGDLSFKTNVGFEEDGLYALTSSYERILSADKRSLTASALSSINDGAGYHYRIIDAEASRNAKYVYYCEQLTDDAPECEPFVYELETDMLHPVTVDGQSVSYPVDEHNSFWLSGSTLHVNDSYSPDATKPWLLETEVQ